MYPRKFANSVFLENEEKEKIERKGFLSGKHLISQRLGNHVVIRYRIYLRQVLGVLRG